MTSGRLTVLLLTDQSHFTYLLTKDMS